MKLNFIIFFDGLIGAEFMAQTEAKLDFENDTVSFENITVPFVKYHPLDYVYHHIITISTLSNCDWFIPCHLKLSDGIIIEPGLYNSTNKKSVIKIMSKSSSKPDNLGTFGLNVNNFETITPIPLTTQDELKVEDIEKIIRSNHLSNFELDELLGIIHQHQQVLLRTNENLTATNVV